MYHRKKIQEEDRIEVHNSKQKVLSSIDKIEKKVKAIKKKHWAIGGTGIVALLLFGPLKKLIKKIL